MNDDVKNIVTQPKHYASKAIEPITYIVENGFNFTLGNVVKYITRAGNKKYEGKSLIESKLLDLRKADYYLKKEIEQTEIEIQSFIENIKGK